jgi:DNA primase
VTVGDDHLAAAHRLLLDGLRQVISGEDWRRFLELSARFHAYSPLNVLLLMAQGAEGRVAGYHTWRTIPAQDGQPCQVAKGASGHRILAPVVRRRAEERPDRQEPVVISRLVGFKTVVVFDQTQLVSPPAIPEPQRPSLLEGAGPSGFAQAVADAITARGFRLRLDQTIAPANGRTDFAERSVTLRSDLSPAQTCKTLAHEFAHIDLHAPSQPGCALPRPVKEVEAETVAWLLTNHAGLDTGDYSFPYLAHWSGGDLQLVAATAQRAIVTARRLADETITRQSRTPQPLRSTAAEAARDSPNIGTRTNLEPSDSRGQGLAM